MHIDAFLEQFKNRGILYDAILSTVTNVGFKAEWVVFCKDGVLLAKSADGIAPIQALRTEMLEWCKVNMKHPYVYDTFLNFAFFADKDDAVLYQLRWG